VPVPGGGTYRRAFGETSFQTHAPRGVDEPFRIASMTKTFIATVVLQLVDEGKLSLADPVAKWYPAFPRGNEITVDHLLRMRSGIPDAFDAEFMQQ
jgi:D-alanyl-D-alanine carboxypeptidase